MLMPGKIRHKLFQVSPELLGMCSIWGYLGPEFLWILCREEEYAESSPEQCFGIQFGSMLLHFSSYFSRRKQRRSLILRLHQSSRALPKGLVCQSFNWEHCGMSFSQGRGADSVPVCWVIKVL